VVTVRVNRHRNKRGLTGSPLVPAAARVPDVLSEDETQLNLEAIETFTRIVGGREALISVLSVCQVAPDVDKVVTFLMDPRYERLSLKKICYLAGLTVADLFVAYTKPLITRAHIQATHIGAAKLPP